MKKKNKLIVILSIIIVILVVVVIVLFVKKGRPISSNGELVKELYSYIGNEDLEKCGGLVFYDKEKIDYDKLSEETKICLAYIKVNDDKREELKIDKGKQKNLCSLKDGLVFATGNYEDKICTLSKTKSDLISEKYEELFGKTIEDYKNFQLDNVSICYYDEDSYYCGLSESYTYVFGAEPHTYRAIRSSFKKGDEIIIYDYFLRTINNDCFTNYVSDDKNDVCSKALENKKDVNYKFLKKYGTKYKHVFKKDNDKYYWVSSEIMD